MIIPKRFRRLISFFLSLALLFQTFAPTIVLAQEALPEPTPTESITPTTEPTPEVTPEVTPNPSPSDTVAPSVPAAPTEAPSISPEPLSEPTAAPSEANPPLAETPTETPIATPSDLPPTIEEPTPIPTPTSLWLEIDADTTTTNENVGEGIDYRFRDSGLIVRFTKLETPGKLTIKQIKLSPEQVELSGALTDIAYDITSDMPNGSFVYDLTLPLAPNTTDAEVKFASSTENLTSSQAVSQTEEINTNTITIRGLDHFTVFFVTSGVDQATNGDDCTAYSLPCEFDVASTSALLAVDQNYLSIADHQNATEPFWPNSEEDPDFGDNYVQFNFSGLTPPAISNARVKIVFKTSQIEDPGEYGFGAKIAISTGDFTEDSIWTQTVSLDPENEDDQTFISNDLSSVFPDPADINDFKVRFYLWGTGETDLLTSSFNQVVLIIPPPTPSAIGWTSENPPVGSDYVGGTDFTNFRTCGGSLNYSPMTNLWQPVEDAAGYDREVYSPENTLIYSHSLSSNYVNGGGAVNGNTYYVRIRAFDEAGNRGEWSEKCGIIYDTTPPTADLIFPTPGPLATGFRVIFSEAVNPDEATDPANYFLDNWPGAGGSGNLVGHADIDYDDETKTATISFSTPGWYISPEQHWGVKNIHDLAGNQLVDTWEYSTPMVSPTVPGIPVSTPNPTNSILQVWTWLPSSDLGGIEASGVKGYWYSLNGTPWAYLGDVLSTTTSLSEGEHELSLKAEDRAGNISASSSGELAVDRTPPTATISYSTTEPTNGDVTATLVPSEPVTVSNNEGLSRVFSENGSFAFEFIDAAGNTGSVTAEVANIDKTAPTGSITAPANNSYKKSKPTFKASASDANGIASVKFQYKPASVDAFIDLNTDTTPNASGLYQASWSGVTLANGTTYDLQIVITDGVGNQSTIGGVSFLYDTQLPDIFYNDPFGGETVWYNTSPLFDIDFLYDEGGSPLDYAQYRLDGGSYKNIFTADRTSDYLTNWGIASWPTLTEGLHQLDLRLRDKAGNINTDNYQESESGLKVGKDLAAPSSTASSPNFANSSPIAVSFTAADDYSGVGQVSLWYRVNAGEWTDSDLSLPGTEGTSDFIPEDGDGTYEFYTIATDNIGNQEPENYGEDESITPDSTTVFDTTKPESVITSPENDGPDNTIYTNDWNGDIAGTATDNLSGLDHIELSIMRLSDGLYWNGEGWSESGEGEPRVIADGTGNWNYSLPEPGEDSYEIVSHAVDNVGNTENSYKLTVILDKTIPEVSITLDPSSPDSGNNWYKTEPTITLTATDDKLTDFIEYQWDNTSGIWTVYGVPFKTIGTGSHTLYYRAFDKAGNVSGTGVKNIKYDNSGVTDAPLNISVSPNPTSGQTAKVKWDAAVDNVGVEKYEVNWSLDGTSTSYTDTVGNEIREHEINKLDQEGKWNITVTAFDYAGNRKSGSTELTVDRSAPAAPILRLAGTGTGEATLNWNLVGDAVDYIIWYGNISGTYLYGARVGNINSFTVRGLGGGDYFFVVKSVDSAGNQSGYSNEVSTLALVGAPGVEPGNPAEGFSPEVRGATTNVDATGSGSPTPEVLGETEGGNLSLWLILAFVASGGLASWAFFRRR